MSAANDIAQKTTPSRPDGQAPPSGRDDTRTFAQKIEDATATVAHCPIGGGLTLAFKVRPMGPAEAAQAGVLQQTIARLIGQARTPDAEDLTGLQAAQMAAAQGTPEDQQARRLRTAEAAARVARRCIVAVQDLDDPSVWRRVQWVSDASQEGDGDGVTRLCFHLRMTLTAVERVALAALAPAVEVAGVWERFRR